MVKKYKRAEIKFKEKIHEGTKSTDTKISLLLSQLNPNFDYLKIDEVDRLYIPLRCFRNVKNREIIKKITSKFDTYMYLPAVITLNYLNLLDSYITSFTNTYDIKGFVFSSMGELKTITDKKYKKFDIISNYTVNVFNNYTIEELKKRGISCITLSPELNKQDIQDIKSKVNRELIVYGKLKVMASKYCLLGTANGCYPECDSKCRHGREYYLKDRMGYKFKIIPNNLQTITNIYNSKILSIEYDDLNIDYARIDILEETIPEINNVIRTVKKGKRFEGEEYTNGNINRFV